MYTSIVVGTDGSERAAAAVRHAAELANRTGAKLHLVRAIGSPVIVGVSGEVAAVAQTPEVLRHHEAALAEEADEVRESRVEVESHVVTASAAAAICDTAERVDADLIVVGNRGMTGKGRFFLGSVPNTVSHHAPCSVLIVNTD